MNAVASMTPPWNPPDGSVCACDASHQPASTTGPASSSATIRTALLVAGTSRSAASSTAGRSRSPRRRRSTVATPAAAANKMNSSPTVSKPRYSKLIADTTPVALVCATTTRRMAGPYGPGYLPKPGRPSSPHR